jgi:hypothetical protein
VLEQVHSDIGAASSLLTLIQKNSSVLGQFFGLKHEIKVSKV